MTLDGGFIKIDRGILDWEWYSDINTTRLFIHLILKANWKDGRFEGIEVPRGSLVTSTNKLSKETGLTVREVRTALKHLEMTHEVTSKGHSKFTVITVKNYCLYQNNDMVSDKPLAIARYTLAVNKAYKKEGEPDADFIPCVAFGKNGEFAEKYLNKGQRIAVVGRLQVRMWEDDKGDKQKTTEVVIENQYFADNKNKSEEKNLSEAVNSHLYPIDDNVEDEDLPF